MVAIASLNSIIASQGTPTWLVDAISGSANQSGPGSVLGMLQGAKAGTSGNFRSMGQSAINSLASVAQSRNNGAAQLTAQLAYATLVKQQQDKLTAALSPLEGLSINPPKEFNSIVYFKNGSTLDPTTNILTMSDGTEIDITTGLQVIDPATTIALANGAYIDTKNNVLHMANGTKIDTVTGLQITT